MKAKILYGSYCSDICGPGSYYGSYLDSVNKRNPLATDDKYDANGDIILATEQEKIDAVSNLKMTVFTFVIDSDGNYGLKSVTFE